MPALCSSALFSGVGGGITQPYRLVLWRLGGEEKKGGVQVIVDIASVWKKGVSCNVPDTTVSQPHVGHAHTHTQWHNGESFPETPTTDGVSRPPTPPSWFLFSSLADQRVKISLAYITPPGYHHAQERMTQRKSEWQAGDLSFPLLPASSSQRQCSMPSDIVVSARGIVSIYASRPRWRRGRRRFTVSAQGIAMYSPTSSAKTQ